MKIHEVERRAITAHYKLTEDNLDDINWPLDLGLFANHMGINLCSVDAMTWTYLTCLGKTTDRCITSITVHFLPDMSSYGIRASVCDTALEGEARSYDSLRSETFDRSQFDRWPVSDGFEEATGIHPDVVDRVTTVKLPDDQLVSMTFYLLPDLKDYIKDALEYTHPFTIKGE